MSTIRQNQLEERYVVELHFVCLFVTNIYSGENLIEIKNLFHKSVLTKISSNGRTKT